MIAVGGRSVATTKTLHDNIEICATPAHCSGSADNGRKLSSSRLTDTPDWKWTCSRQQRGKCK
jgi:hypothetical protein